MIPMHGKKTGDAGLLNPFILAKRRKPGTGTLSGAQEVKPLSDPVA
jgi:hypothetical protein